MTWFPGIGGEELYRLVCKAIEMAEVEPNKELSTKQRDAVYNTFLHLASERYVMCEKDYKKAIDALSKIKESGILDSPDSLNEYIEMGEYMLNPELKPLEIVNRIVDYSFKKSGINPENPNDRNIGDKKRFFDAMKEIIELNENAPSKNIKDGLKHIKFIYGNFLQV